MSDLIIHPEDSSTDFLKRIYQQSKDKIVIKDKEPDNFLELLKNSTRVFLLGHGCADGLFFFIEMLNKSEVIEELKKKGSNVFYIWCHASSYVEKHDLQGLATGMFVSETDEALYYEIDNSEIEIDYSNNLFAKIIGDNIDLPTKDIYELIHQEYNAVIESEVINFNLERLRLFINH